MKGTFVSAVFFCLLWLVFANQFEIMSETSFSWDTVGRELWLAILSSLLCLERTGIFASDSKVMCLF